MNPKVAKRELPMLIIYLTTSSRYVQTHKYGPAGSVACAYEAWTRKHDSC
ncbi:hypothetical protein ACFLXO_05800 [Chloroflexota bacterium]